MTAKEYLLKIQTYRRIMQSYADRIEELYHDASGLKAIVYDKDRVQTSPQDHMEAVFVKIDREAEKYAKARARYEAEARKRMEEIAGLDNPVHVQLLVLRYIEGKSWEEIACAIGYTFRHTTRLHGDALNAFSRKYKDVL